LKGQAYQLGWLRRLPLKLQSAMLQPIKQNKDVPTYIYFNNLITCRQNLTLVIRDAPDFSVITERGFLLQFLIYQE